MKRVNKVGPELTKNLAPVTRIDATELERIAAKYLVLDTSAANEFARGHVPGTVNLPASNLVQWAGFFADYTKPIYLIADEKSLPSQLRSLRSIGIDKVGGFFDAAAIKADGRRTESYRSTTPVELRVSIDGGDVTLIDVRATTEFQAGHIPGAEHRFLGTLLRNIDSISRDKPVVVQCLAGGRSAIAASILQRGGFDVINMQGGYQAWVAAGLPVVQDAVAAIA